jgi:hypothetical protein
MIHLPLKGDVEQLLAKVAQAVTEHGGQFSGDGKGGKFSGKTLLGEVHGKYVIDNDAVSISILRKPAMVPMGMIEKEIRGFFAHK